MRFKLRTAICPLLLTGILMGCAPQPDFESVYTRLNAPELQAGDTIPAPTEAVILSLSGQVGARNTGRTADGGAPKIIMDRSTIEAVGLVEYTVEDPFEKANRTFTGVLVKDLLALWQIPSTATTLDIQALNDYQVDVPIELVQDYPVMLALKQDGEYMTPDYRGPAMLVFPYGYYDFVVGTDSYWVWQIKAITVK